VSAPSPARGWRVTPVLSMPVATTETRTMPSRLSVEGGADNDVGVLIRLFSNAAGRFLDLE